MLFKSTRYRWNGSTITPDDDYTIIKAYDVTAAAEQWTQENYNVSQGMMCSTYQRGILTLKPHDYPGLDWQQFEAIDIQTIDIKQRVHQWVEHCGEVLQDVKRAVNDDDLDHARERLSEAACEAILIERYLANHMRDELRESK
jgi:hypothetical protein